MLSLRRLIAALLLLVPLSAAPAWATSFVTRSGSSLELDGSTFRFSGVDLELPSTYSISDGVNTTLTGSVPNGGVHIATGWTTAASTVTVYFSAGWGGVIDDITYNRALSSGGTHE